MDCFGRSEEYGYQEDGYIRKMDLSEVILLEPTFRNVGIDMRGFQTLQLDNILRHFLNQPVDENDIALIFYWFSTYNYT